MAESMPQLNFKRLLKEFRQVQGAIAEARAPGIIRCEPENDNLLCWGVDVRFPDESLLQQSLERLAVSLFDESQSCLTLQVRFPPEFPNSPPEVWLRRPRLKRLSAPVTFGGKLCNFLLTSAGWVGMTSMTAVLAEIRSALVDAGAEVDITVSMKQDYPVSPVGLDRLSTERIPKANDFEMQATVLSAVEASGFLGDLSRLEGSDKIGLPFELAQQIYGRASEGLEIDMPLLFEVKTHLGRKVHCAIFDFVAGLPLDYVLLPKWVMDDIFLEERARVRVRGVKLPLISFVKVQPHSVDFYAAVKDSGREVGPLLTESLGRFSALTEETSVPIEINGGSYNVQIVELRPLGAVRIIDTDCVHEFQFEVDFDPAPDLEDEDAVKARQDKMIARIKARSEYEEEQRKYMDDKRTKTRRLHYEELCKEANAAAEVGGDDGTAGPVEVALRLPDGSQLKGQFREGAPIAAIANVALRSTWAEGCAPWRLRLLMAFPRRVLKESDVVGRDMHRSAITVQEEQAPVDDDELFAAVRHEGSGKSWTSAREEEGNDLEEPPLPLPGADEGALQRQTQRAFEVQRLVRAGVAFPEAERRVEAGEVLPPTTTEVAAGPAPLLNRLAGAVASAAATAATAAAAVVSSNAYSVASTHGPEVARLVDLTGADPEAAALVLQSRNNDIEAAVNDLLDSM